MKLLLCSIASCFAMAAMPATAAADGSTDYQALVNTVDQALHAWRADKPTKPYWDDIKSQIPGWTDAATEHKERLARAIQDLIERAKNAQLILEDFWRTKAMIIDCKCNTEVRILWKQAKNRDATRRQFEYVANLLHERGEAAKEHPDMRQLLQDGINKLMKKYLAGEDLTLMETRFFDDEMVRSMLDRAVKWLEDMAVERKATREQFEYVRDLMKDRARIWSEDLEMQALLRRVEAEIERLMGGDLATVGFGREDFLKLREMVLKKAREVVSTPTGAAG
jgi:vacuolar-type H+-ATPase subunit I/STV1